MAMNVGDLNIDKLLKVVKLNMRIKTKDWFKRLNHVLLV